MARYERSGLAYALLAALLWSPHFSLVERLQVAGPQVPQMVAHFHFVFWAAAGLLLVLFLSGRLDELSIFGRRETQILVLGALGGYGFWLFRGLALESLPTSRARLLFYAAPIAVGVFSSFGRERADSRTFFGLLLGFVGCIMLAEGAMPGGGPAGGMKAHALGALAAAGWGLFTLCARPLAREEKALPAVALILGVGAVCLFVTCLSTGANVLRVSVAQLGLSAVAGFFTVGVMMLAWLRCLRGVPAVAAAPWWYLGLAFAAAGRLVFAGGWGEGVWWVLGGAVLILMALHSAGAGRTGQAVTMGDIIRGGT